MCYESFKTLYTSLLLLVILTLSSALQRCKVKDGECLKMAAQNGAPILAKGISELGTEPLDTMFVDVIKVELAGLKMMIRNAQIEGLKNVIIDDVRIDTTKKSVRFKYHVNIRLRGQYKASGRLLILPISGDGNTTISLKNLHIELTLPYEITKKNGQDTVELQGYSFKYDIKDGARFHLTNLFNGNKLLMLPVEKCRFTDSPCLVKAFQKAVPIYMGGIPEIGIEVLDVMEMDDVKFDLSGLQFSLEQGRLKGMKNAIIDNVKWNPNKKNFNVEFHLNTTIKGHYKAGGRILVLPIMGDGEMKLKLRNVAIKFIISYVIEKGSDGKDKIMPKSYKFTFDVKDGAHFDLSNLFNGNKELSDAMLKFLNEQWKQISIEFGKPLMDAAAKKIFKNIVTFFGQMPLEEITVN